MNLSTPNNNSNNVNCAGFVIICQNHVLLVSTHKGNWGFPKGKRNTKPVKEDLITCAYRELQEETGLMMNQIKPVEIETFSLYELTRKGIPSVKLFLATTDDLINPKIDDEYELADAKWITIDEALKLLTLKNRKQILLDAIDRLKY